MRWSRKKIRRAEGALAAAQKNTRPAIPPSTNSGGRLFTYMCPGCLTFGCVTLGSKEEKTVLLIK